MIRKGASQEVIDEIAILHVAGAPLDNNIVERSLKIHNAQLKTENILEYMADPLLRQAFEL